MAHLKMFMTLRRSRISENLRSCARLYATNPPVKQRHRLRNFLIGSGVIISGGALYNYYNGNAISRSIRTLSYGALVAADFHFNFSKDSTQDDLDQLHIRTAQRMEHVIKTNGGLYIKIGQAIAMNSAVLPPIYADLFTKLLDKAPFVEWSEIEPVIFHDLQISSLDELFSSFNKKPEASASIAQVHRATLKTGEDVAVKVLKPAVQKQINWDLASYKILMYLYEKFVFDLPLQFAVDYITSQFKFETDFRHEASNATISRKSFQSSPKLRDRVYVPKVFEQASGDRVMTAEWVDGIKCSDKKAILDSGLNTKEIMQTIVEMFSAQMFEFGHLHCDPHAGNLFIQNINGHPRVVLIDFGLQIDLSPELRQQYAKLWKALVTFDNKEIAKIAEGWGINSPDLLASATMMRPYSSKTIEDDFVADDPVRNQMIMKEKLKNFLHDTEKIPRELIFTGRNMRMVQANNQQFGSPVNRIGITANWASKSLVNAPKDSVKEYYKSWADHLKFKFVLSLISATFWVSRIWQIVTRSDEGFEDILENSMRRVAKAQFGHDPGAKAFNG